MPSELFSPARWQTSREHLAVRGAEVCCALRLENLTSSFLCDSFAQEILGNGKKHRVLERFYHADVERKQLTKWQCWNLNYFQEYLTHAAGTSQLFFCCCKDPHHIILLAKSKNSAFHRSSVTANALYDMKGSYSL